MKFLDIFGTVPSNESVPFIASSTFSDFVVTDFTRSSNWMEETCKLHIFSKKAERSTYKYNYITIDLLPLRFLEDSFAPLVVFPNLICQTLNHYRCRIKEVILTLVSTYGSAISAFKSTWWQAARYFW